MRGRDLAAMAVFLAVLLSPLLWLGRVISPADVLSSYDPWARTLPATAVQNPHLDDPATGWMPSLLRAKRLPEGWRWNPYLAAGLPGYADLTPFLLSPIVSLPALLLPAAWLFTAIVLLRFLAGFLTMRALARDLGRAPEAATIAGLLWGGAGGVTVWWLWPHTSSSVFFPLLVLGVRRAFRSGRPWSRFGTFAVATLLVCSGGYPPWAIYGALLALVALLAELAHARQPSCDPRPPRRSAIAGLVAAGLLGLLPLVPSIAIFSDALTRSGHLERRAERLRHPSPLPLAHLRLFFDPWTAGAPTDDTRFPDMPGGNNLVENSVELGRLALPLVALGCLTSIRRRGDRPWMALAIALPLGLYSAGGVAVLSRIPGVALADLGRIRIVWLFALILLAARGAEALAAVVPTRLATLLPIAIAIELALFDVRVLPYLPPASAGIPTTPVLERLKLECARSPARLVATANALWPNLAEAAGLEDVRSHLASEAEYRRLLATVDPRVFGELGTFLLFDPLRVELSSPILDRLAVRWVAEPPVIDLVAPLAKDRHFGPTLLTGTFLVRALGPGQVIEQPVALRGRAFRLGVIADGNGIELKAELAEEWSGRVLMSSTMRADDSGDGRLWLDLTPLPTTSESTRLRLRVWHDVADTTVALAAAQPDAVFGTAQVAGRRAPQALAVVVDAAGLRLRRDVGGHELRIYERLGGEPFWKAVWDVEPGGIERLIADHDQIDSRRVAIVEATDLSAVRSHLANGSERRAQIRILDHRPERYAAEVELEAAALVVVAIKFDSPHASRLDGNPILALQTDGMLRGYLVPAGRHRLELTVGPFAALGRPAYDLTE